MSIIAVPKSAIIRARIEPELKTEAEAVLKQIGLSTSDLMSMTFRQLVMRQGLPFEARIPNAETRAAIAEPREGLTSYADPQQMMRGILAESD